ncbi:uncharacterized protein LOC115887245 [Sitophilus oryzae]|uniref:Uncharacterized protein LOC115887245 n=1 Tax=Sitophilus oryzae TaxID=7048 RepID=A0A6J2YHW2_SITOR|nr:uncharacterized protein LOC115887245 [Sitophilus oryzae]
MEWSEEKSLCLVGNYKLHRNLWDSRHFDYFKKDVKTRTWNKIGLAVGASPADCKRKIMSLLATYRKEKNKIRTSKKEGSDEVYTTRWFAYNALQFLKLRNKPWDNRASLVVDNETPEVVSEPPPVRQPQQVRPATSVSDNKQLVTEDLAPEREFQTTAKRFRKDTEQSEFDIFGQSVASQLKSLPLKEALELQLELQQIITEKRLILLQQNCFANSMDSMILHSECKMSPE